MRKKILNIAVFASGGGSNWNAILHQIKKGTLPVSVAWVLSNNSTSGACSIAEKAGIPTLHVSAKTEGSEEGVERKMLTVLFESAIDFIVLAGYMKKIPQAVLHKYKNRILNIHPALLPAFGGQGWYGKRIHQGVLERGCQVTGITIHLINEEYDAGPILLQKIVPVFPTDNVASLALRVLEIEHKWYWQVLYEFSIGNLWVQDGVLGGLASFKERFISNECFKKISS